jgi:hypothetical protein
MNSCRISATWPLLLLRVAAIVELMAVLAVIPSICLCCQGYGESLEIKINGEVSLSC